MERDEAIEVGDNGVADTAIYDKRCVSCLRNISPLFDIHCLLLLLFNSFITQFTASSKAYLVTNTGKRR